MESDPEDPNVCIPNSHPQFTKKASGARLEEGKQNAHKGLEPERNEIPDCLTQDDTGTLFCHSSKFQVSVRMSRRRIGQENLKG